jgi:hypothetical protein
VSGGGDKDYSYHFFQQSQLHLVWFGNVTDRAEMRVEEESTLTVDMGSAPETYPVRGLDHF